MADVGEPSAFGFYFRNKVERFLEVHVHGMLPVMQGTRYQVFCSKNFFFFNIGNCFYIGQISQAAEPKAQNRNVPMDYFNRLNSDVADRKRCVVVNLNQLDAGYARDGRAENILESSPYLLGYSRQGVNFHRLTSAKIEWADVVQPDDVVVVLVGEQYSVQMADFGAEHLLAQVGASVNQDVSGSGGNEGGGAEAVVERVVGTANYAIATDDGDSLRGAGAEECEFQVVAQSDANDAANISKIALLRLGYLKFGGFCLLYLFQGNLSSR